MVQDFSRNYAPPGVYIEEGASTVIASTGIPPTLVGLVGPARGYQIATEQILLQAEAVTLLNKGIDATTVSLSVVATGAAVPSGDYSTAKVGNTGQDYQTTVQAGSSPSVSVGTPVFVTYRYTDPDYFAAHRLESFEDVKDLYGEPLNTDVVSVVESDYQYVLSPLSLAAMLAFQNGATEVWTVAATPPPSSASSETAKSTARRTALNEAYKKLDFNPQINVLVGITTGIGDSDASGALTDLKVAVERASNEGNYRFGITGFGPAVDTDPDEIVGVAGAGYRRLMLAYAAPDGLSMYSGAANSTFAVGHEFLAAAYGGRMAALPVQYSLTKQVIAGFTGLAGTPIPNSLKNSLSSAGVAVVEQDRFSRLVVRHGVTTDMTNVNTKESAVVRAKDALVTSISDGLVGSGLIGSPIDSDTLLNVKSAVQGVLESAVATDTIFAYSELAARQTSNDPSVIEVKFAYRPAYPLNYVVVSFSIDMNSGVTPDANTDATVV